MRHKTYICLISYIQPIHSRVSVYFEWNLNVLSFISCSSSFHVYRFALANSFIWSCIDLYIIYYYTFPVFYLLYSEPLAVLLLFFSLSKSSPPSTDDEIVFQKYMAYEIWWEKKRMGTLNEKCTNVYTHFI